MNLLARSTSGALAGLGGALSMHSFRLLWESATHGKRENGIFGFDCEADVNAARLLGSTFGWDIPEADAQKLGIALHYGFSALLGALYRNLSTRKPKIRAGFGTAFGTLTWLVADEISISVSGISNPFKKSALSHAGALASHLLFGIVVESISRTSGESVNLRNGRLSIRIPANRPRSTCALPLAKPKATVPRN